MPTPVSAARQCLAGEAATALDGAVTIARRRAHSQTTSLHVVSALLSLPSSSPSLLRDALARARSAIYPSRLQSKALEICFSAALDRLPAAASGSGGGSSQQPPAEPPVANSLMAAIKRSQANQRRNPDAFHLYQHQYPQQQQQQQLNSPSIGPKVELQQLVLSILDDPIVSRVFGEAGFRSYDVKLAILRPPPSVLRYPRAGGRCPPLFLCNFSLGADDFDLASRGFPFPLSPQPLHSDGADENCRRIADVLKRGRNVLLVGVGGYDAARDFERAVASQKWASFPTEFSGLRFLSLEKEVVEFVGGGRDRPWVDSKFRDLGLQLAAEEFLSSQGAVLCFGDLKRLVDMVGEEESDGLGRVGYVVSELTRVVDGHPGRLRLMGWAATYETYMKFLSLCPPADKDWSLQLLPITSLKPASGSGDVLSGPKRLMESFVPLGGFFPVSTDAVPPVSRQCQSSGPCQLCSDKYEQELADLLKELSAPAGVEFQLNPYPFQQQTELITINSGVDVEKLTEMLMDLRGKTLREAYSLSKEGNNGYELSLRGKTVVDHIAAEICKKPWSVVFLENVDKADMLVQASLFQAIKTGRFSDSHRREIAISNAVFVTTAQTIRNESCIPSKLHTKYTEERILAAQPWQMKVVVVSASNPLGGKLCLNVSGASWKEMGSDSVLHARKRKLNMVDAADEQCPSTGAAKGTNKSSNTCLDLNLPVEELGADDTGYNSDGNSHISDDMSAAWMEEFLNSVDETIIFKPFDFDALASDIQNEISESFHTAVGSNYVLDIGPKVMEQVLAATWSSEAKGAMSNWIQQVLVRSFIDAQKVHHPPPQSVFRLVACDDTFVEACTPGIHLPLRILLD
ncbi:hypothetical protein Taro_029971 [Colocasia esculenta]|uniref:Clp R domain-containing protein n=1 Tax=Colocasia esculenta TaxID=4460 RepID=A0A843VWG8_COLES|nr:hypothetical protein [Colocasia esculenta]